jgi:hypothetical protein
MNSPWGIVQHVKKMISGVSQIGTEGHGGIRISIGFAKKHLSPEAIKRAIHMGSYLYYEEDCNYAIPCYEIYNLIYKDEKHKPKLLKSLSIYNADYLLERSITPEPEGYKIYLKGKLQDKMRSENHPDFIVSAIYSDVSGIIKVTTADNKEHYVKSESYDYMNRDLNLLSYCDIAVI